MRVTLQEAEGHLAELIQLAHQGEEVVITENEQPVIKLVNVERPKKKRVLGLHAGVGWISDDFNEPLDDSFWLGDDAS